MAPGIDISRATGPLNSASVDQVDTKSAVVMTTSIPSSPTSSVNEAITSATLVPNPASITEDFDLLRFEAAAFEQLCKANDQSTTLPTSAKDTTLPSQPTPSTLLISSPYNNPGHYLDLTSLPLPSLLFAKALTSLRPIRPDYATAAYTSALNFSTVLSVLREISFAEGTVYPETSFYIVTFRSRLKEGIDNDWLYKLDFESHREACESGGLLKYWFGKADGEKRNLATCFWHSRDDAYKGGLGPWHKKARAAGRELYERITFSTHRFTILRGAEEFVFEDWKE